VKRGLVGVGCFAHSRRHQYESLSSNIPTPAPALCYIGLLYRIERKARGWSAAERLDLRQRCAMPVLAELKVYMERTQVVVLPKSPEDKAIACAELLGSTEPLGGRRGPGDQLHCGEESARSRGRKAQLEVLPRQQR